MNPPTTTETGTSSITRLSDRMSYSSKNPEFDVQSTSTGNGGEGIQVAIRMRPLNSKEHTHNKVWKVLSKYSSITQTTTEGKPLPERITGRNFFTYDQTYDETTSTYQVYTGIAQPIVLSTVCTGKNGTIFAYGQTSSGKTYTMQGAGTLVDGSSTTAGSGYDDSTNGSGGIVHMAAHDIFAQIASVPDRIFDVRVSFLEIYNEEVRDLLQDYSNQNKVLQIREDPRRGVFVESKEVIVTDAHSLLSVLWQGEKSRSFASTAMNERSSRSHTIFRITIESRSRNIDDGENGSNLEDDTGSGAVRVSTLNLVDLAGSESVRHTGATGDRQKEGGMINQSLLTLSRVIVALGTPSATHVNFRDSKLTRILQPSLSGNARMAVVCCATPSELYLEETRSTLLFASRAKLVKTNAQINEVLDDRSIIRKLQRELAMLRNRQNSGGGQWSINVERLENLALSAEQDAQTAKEKLRRMCRAILMNKALDDSVVHTLLGTCAVDYDGDSSLDSMRQHDQIPVEMQEQISRKRPRRRLSDGDLQATATASLAETPTRMKNDAPPPSSVPTKMTKSASDYIDCTRLSPSAEVHLLRTAVASKDGKVTTLQRQIDKLLKQLQSKDTELVAANGANDLLRADRDEKSTFHLQMRAEIEDLKSELVATKSSSNAALSEKESIIFDMKSQLQQQFDDRKVLEEAVDSLQDSKALFEREAIVIQKEKDNQIVKLQQELELCRGEAAQQANDFQESCKKLEIENEALSNSLEVTNSIVASISATNNELEEQCEEYMEEIKILTDKYNDTCSELGATNTKLAEMVEIAKQEKEIVSQLENIRSEHEETIQNLTTENNLMMTNLMSTSNEILELKNQKLLTNIQIDTIAKERETLQTEFDKLKDIATVTEIKLNGMLVVAGYNESIKEELSNKRNEAESLVKQQLVASTDLEARLSNATTENNVLNNRLATMTETCDELNKALNKSNEQITSFANENMNLKEMNAKLDDRMDELNIQCNIRISNLQQALNDAVQAGSLLHESYANCFHDASTKIDVLSIMLHRSQLEQELMTLAFNEKTRKCKDQFTDKLQEMASERDEAIQNRSTTESEMNILQNTLRQIIDQNGLLTTEHDTLKTDLAELRISETKLKDEIDRLNEEISFSKSEINDQIFQIQDCIRERDEALEYVQNIRKEKAVLEVKVKCLDEMSEVINKLKMEVRDISDQNASLQQKLDTYTSLSNDLQDENRELKLLLANANITVDEARAASTELAKQLEAKSRDCQDLQTQLITSNNDTRRAMESKQQQDLQKLIKENECLQSQLKQVADDQATLEAGLRRQMSDEQRALIHEAEQEMSGLRAKLVDTERALKLAEAEVYATHETKIDLEDQYKREVDHVAKLQNQIVSLNEENARLRRLAKNMEIENESTISALKQALIDANKVSYEHGAKLRDAESYVTRLQDEKADVTHQSIADKEQLEASLRQSFDEKKSLSLEIERLKQEIINEKNRSKENDCPSNRVKELEDNNDKLRRKLKSYVDRCAKLEEKKLTKDRVDFFQTLQSNNSRLEKDLNEAKNEINKLQYQLSTKSTVTLENSEITALRFDKEALESKFRKLAAQYQSLEDEKLRSLQPLKSAKGIVYDGSIEKAIVSLCDKVASLEQECSIVDRMKIKNVELEQKIATQAQIEVKHKESISSLESRIKIIQDKLETKQKILSSLEDTVKYLERENLELIEGSKAANKKIQQYKAEQNRLQAQINCKSMSNPRNIPKPKTIEPILVESKHKENVGVNENQIVNPSSATASKEPVHNQHGSHVKGRNISANIKDAFAAGDENTQECKQS